MTLTPHPSLHQPRDHGGRFGTVDRSESLGVRLDLDNTADRAACEVVWPELDADPAEAQDVLYAICWAGDVDDQTRALAARGALAMAVAQHGRYPSVAPTDEAQDLVVDASTDDDTLLDAVHALGPMAYPQTQEFGTRLAGALYDLHEERLQARHLLIEQAAARRR